MSTEQTGNDIVVSETKKGWRSFLRGRRKFVLLAIVVLLVAAGGYWWLSTNEPPKPKVADTTTAPKPNVVVPEPTAEQKRLINAVVRAEGSITAIAKDSVTVKPNDQTDPLVLKTDDKTLYTSGTNGFPAERTALKPGQKAVFSYDKDLKTALSIWVDYEAQ
jgi:hypothetical protein